MAYFIFVKNSETTSNSLYRIAENQSDLNSLNINKSDYSIIEDSQLSFDNVKYGKKVVEKYENNSIIYSNIEIKFCTKKSLIEYVFSIKSIINEFLNSNKNHPQFNLWNNYYNQLNSLYSQLNLLDFNSISFPLNSSLEQYFKDQNQISLNTLQLP